VTISVTSPSRFTDCINREQAVGGVKMDMHEFQKVAKRMERMETNLYVDRRGGISEL
jgi:hypothetical protein